MLYGNSGGIKITAQPGLSATCPGCGASLKPKCGSIVSWHWAHKANDCDPWHEPECEWHLAWKRQFPPEMCEISIGPHRADIYTGKLVVELQHSSISPEEIEKRERHYGKMAWLIDAEPFSLNFDFRRRDGFFSFRWRTPRKSLWSCTRPLYFDLGYVYRACQLCDVLGIKQQAIIFWAKKIHADIPCGGWGVPLTHEEFKLNVLSGQL